MFVTIEDAIREINEDLKYCDPKFKTLYNEILKILEDVRLSGKFRGLKFNKKYVAALLKAYPDFKNDRIYKKYYV